jgi:hypothetical protein
MPRPLLNLRELNRATLARQYLLDRAGLPVPELVEHLVGLQAQTPQSWYVGLWNRLAGFRPEEASDLLERRELVRTALLRSTIHLVTARDALALRPLVQIVGERTFRGAFGRNVDGVDRAELEAAVSELLAERPRTFAELGRALQERWPDRDATSLAQAARAWFPLIQVPPRGLWRRSGPVAHTTAEVWLGPAATAPRPASIDDLVRRYLAAFGPATVQDIQTWCGLTRLAEVVERLRSSFLAFLDEEGHELFDLPEAPRPDPDTPAPPRLLYDFDNLLLSHADRSRFVTDAYRARAHEFIAANVMPSIVLLNGFTAGTWKIRRQRGTSTLAIQPFHGRFAQQVTSDLTAEGACLLEFVAPGDRHEIDFVAPDAPLVGLPSPR